MLTGGYSSSSVPHYCFQWNVPGTQQHKRWAEERQKQQPCRALGGYSSAFLANALHITQKGSSEPLAFESTADYCTLPMLTQLHWHICGSQALRNSYPIPHTPSLTCYAYPREFQAQLVPRVVFLVWFTFAHLSYIYLVYYTI